MLEAPLEAVLPTFLKVKPSAKPKTISGHAKELLEIRQELDYLKREVRTKRVDPDIAGPGEARMTLRNYIRHGMPKELIIRRLVDRGASERWVIGEIKKITRRRIKKPRA